MSRLAQGCSAVVLSFGLTLLLTVPASGEAGSTGGETGVAPAYRLKYAGSLHAPDGKSVSGRRTLVFDLQDRTPGGVPIWTEKQEVEVREGKYSTLLGTAAPLTAPPGNRYTLSVHLEGATDPIEVHEVSIAAPVGRDGIARSVGIPVYRLLLSPDPTGRGAREAAPPVGDSPASVSGLEISAFDEAIGHTEETLALASSAPRLLFVGVEIEEIIGNADGSLEPGETVNLKVKLYNDSNALATSIFGTLDYLGTNSDVNILDKTASWPDLAARSAPALTNPSHFLVTLASTLACGTVLPFRIEVTTGTGHIFDLDFSLKAGQRIDYDMFNDVIRRFNEHEAAFWGANAFDALGISAALGDINGDGHADLILGAMFGDSTGNTRFDAGEVYLVYGRSSQWTDTDLLSPPAGVARFWGADSGDQLGQWSVASGDVNGDGFDEMILAAASGASTGNTRLGAGEVYLVYGKSSQWTDTDLLNTQFGIARFWGADGGDSLGSSVASGDVNGDGFDELILGAIFGDSTGNTRLDAGEVFLVYGRSSQWTDTDLQSPPPGVARFWGAEIGDEFGISVASGDVNGDGFDELILGAYGGDSTGNTRGFAGEVYLVYGRSSPWADTDLLSPPSGVARFWGADDSDRLGLSVASGDVNGDGLDDLVLGAGFSGSTGNTRGAAGEVYLVYGRSSPWTDTDLFTPPSGVVRFWGADVGDRLGTSVATGDMNGDGFADLILEANGGDSIGNTKLDAGEVYLVQGRSGPWTDTDLMSPPSGVARFWGADTNDRLGRSIASGDVNGDGFDDLVLGTADADSIGNTRGNAGEVSLWYGKPTDTYYSRADSFSFIDASIGTSLPALACDDCSTSVPIGFSFPFYSEEYSTLYVSSNGVISFAPISDLASANPICIPARNPANLLVAPFWDDLNPAAGGTGSGVFTLLQGTAPNRRLTIEWKDVPHYPDIGAATFEVTLFESSGHILVQYADTEFGHLAFDIGAAAVAGVENGKGAQGSAYSCFVDSLLWSAQAVRFVPTTPVIEMHAESDTALWTPSGLWHLSAGTCEPDQHTGTTGWYYGQESSCNYETGSPNFGALDAPTIPDFPADTRLSFWHKRQVEFGPFDRSKIQISTTGTSGPYSDVLDIGYSTFAWYPADVTNIFSAPEETVDVRLFFNTGDAVNNFFLGWMVDDVQLVGCDATGAPSVAAAATAYAEPDTYCQGGTGTLDALGSFCGDSGVPSGYQWRRDSQDLAGETAVTHTIPPTEPAGAYEYSVAITCPGGAMDESDAQRVTIVPPPPEVGPTLSVVAVPTISAPASLTFMWTDVAGADDYAVFQDTGNGPFATMTGVASSGSPGLTVPMPPGTLLYFLVAGRNAVCGAGPKS